MPFQDLDEPSLKGFSFRRAVLMGWLGLLGSRTVALCGMAAELTTADLIGKPGPPEIILVPKGKPKFEVTEF